MCFYHKDMKDAVENEEIVLDTSGTECPIPVLKARKLSQSLKKGDIVIAKQKIGKVFTNQKSGKSTIQFSIFNNTVPQNPKNWIFEM